MEVPSFRGMEGTVMGPASHSAAILGSNAFLDPGAIGQSVTSPSLARILRLVSSTLGATGGGSNPELTPIQRARETGGMK